MKVHSSLSPSFRERPSAAESGLKYRRTGEIHTEAASLKIGLSRVGDDGSLHVTQIMRACPKEKTGIRVVPRKIYSVPTKQ